MGGRGIRAHCVGPLRREAEFARSIFTKGLARRRNSVDFSLTTKMDGSNTYGTRNGQEGEWRRQRCEAETGETRAEEANETGWDYNNEGNSLVLERRTGENLKNTWV